MEEVGWSLLPCEDIKLRHTHDVIAATKSGITPDILRFSLADDVLGNAEYQDSLKS